VYAECPLPALIAESRLDVMKAGLRSDIVGSLRNQHWEAQGDVATVAIYT